jgi:hypothetical protein
MEMSRAGATWRLRLGFAVARAALRTVAASILIMEAASRGCGPEEMPQ